MKHTGGFTLLELLISITIFAMIGIGSYQVLDAVLRAEIITDERSTQIARLQRAYLLLGLDFRQITDRQIRDEYGERQPALLTPVRGPELEFSRAGWRNPLGQQRAELQRVAFYLEDGKLYRQYWLVLDRAQDSKPLTQLVMDGIEQLGLRMLAEDGRWHRQWPPGGDLDAGLPTAVELELAVSGIGPIRWLFEVAR